MAIIGTTQDEDQNGQGAPAGGVLPGVGGNANAAPPTTGGGSGYIGGGSGQGATTSVKSAPTAPGAPTSSGNYTNLMSYLGANQGTGAAMGKTAENVVGQVGNAATSDLAKYNTDTNKAIAAGTPGVDQGVLANINNGIATGASTTKTNADGSVTTTGGKETYNGYTPPTATYGGPSDTSSVAGQAATDQKGADGKSGAYGAIAQLVGGAPGSGTYNGGLVGQAGGGQTGVQSLLKGAYAQPSYTAGESGLDAFLTGGTPGGQQSLKNIQTQWGGMGAKADSVNAGLNSNIAAGRGAAAAANDAYAKAVKAAQAKAAAYNPTSTTTAAPTLPQGPVSIPTVPTQGAAAPTLGQTAAQTVGRVAGSQAGQAAGTAVTQTQAAAQKAASQTQSAAQQAGTAAKNASGANGTNAAVTAAKNASGVNGINPAKQASGTNAAVAAGKAAAGAAASTTKAAAGAAVNTAKATTNPVNAAKAMASTIGNKGDQSAGGGYDPTNANSFGTNQGGVAPISLPTTPGPQVAAGFTGAGLGDYAGLAHGGRIPSYDEILKMVKGK